MDNDIYQKQYDFELEQRNSLASATNIPIVALTVIGSALSTMVLGFKYDDNFISCIFIILSVLSSLIMLKALYCAVRSFLGYSYQKIPPAKEMYQHHKELLDWYFQGNKDPNDAEVLAKNDFNLYFYERLSEAAEHNGSNNIMRGNYLHDATMYVVVSFVCITLSAPIYVFNNVKESTDIKKVQLIDSEFNKKELIKMTTNNESAPEPTAVPTTPAPVQPSVSPISVKPTGPQNTIFKGNVDESGRSNINFSKGGEE